MIGEGQTDGYSARFASRNFYLEKQRTPIDDLESLVFSMWYIADVPMVSFKIAKNRPNIMCSLSC